MTADIGRNRNTNAEAGVSRLTVTTTATTLAPANPDRTALSVNLDAGDAVVEVFVRLYPAGTDNEERGILLQRDTMGNTSIMAERWDMSPDNIYTGEVSAISVAGDAVVHVTEY